MATIGTLVGAQAQDTTTTTGTGAITLANAVPATAPPGSTTFGAQFAPLGFAGGPVNNIFYAIIDTTGNIEVGLGTLTSNTNLTRDYVLGSYTGGALTLAAQTPDGTHVNFAAGTKQVYSNTTLFATSVAIHWEVGGSLATTLSTVGRTVRDRIELSRRVRAQGIEANASVAVVLLIAYVLGFLMWRTNPDRLEGFVKSGFGTELVAGVIALQALGLVWMSRLSRSTF